VEVSLNDTRADSRDEDFEVFEAERGEDQSGARLLGGNAAHSSRPSLRERRVYWSEFNSHSSSRATVESCSRIRSLAAIGGRSTEVMMIVASGEAAALGGWTYHVYSKVSELRYRS
jgi:hypothetical protein